MGQKKVSSRPESKGATKVSCITSHATKNIKGFLEVERKEG